MSFIPDRPYMVDVVPCDVCALPTKVYRDGVLVAIRVPRADYADFIDRIDSDPARLQPPAGTPIR